MFSGVFMGFGVFLNFQVKESFRMRSEEGGVKNFRRVVRGGGEKL